MPLAPASVVKEASLCLGVDENNTPLGVSNTFPANTEKVGLFLRIAGAPANTEIKLEWSHEGKLARRHLLIATGDQKAITYIFPARAEFLQPGTYDVAIKQADQLVGRLVFTIQ